MVLLPFINLPHAKLMILRIIARSRKDYITIQTLPNSAEMVWELFEYSLKWITAKPIDFTFGRVHAQGWIFSPPDAHFSKLTFGILVEIDSAFTRYLRTNKEELIFELVSNIYKTEKPGEGDRMKAISQITYPYQLDVFRMYMMLREKMFQSFTHLFPQPKTLSKKPDTKPVSLEKIPDSTDMWHSLLFSLAETPAYQGMSTAKNANMWEALTYLDEKAFQAKKSKKEK